MKLFHTSDIHLSFTVDGKIAKPMDLRSWSKGTNNYVGYLEKLKSYMELNATWGDLLVVTGDIVHDMPKSKIVPSLQWLDKEVRGIKLIIRGNHDWGMDFGTLRLPDNGLSHTFMLEERSTICLDKYAFGCYSDHKGAHLNQITNEQPTFNNRVPELLSFAEQLVSYARYHKKIPILLSHYPVPLEVGTLLSIRGIKAYLSGHLHCTSNKVLPAQADWGGYNATCAQTDDKSINGCYFSTGTTDVLLNRTGTVIKRIDGYIAESPKIVQKQGQKLPKLATEPAEQIIILCGLPGSGKTTWAKESVVGQWDIKEYEYISQDILGSKQACYNVVAKALSMGKKVIVDRVNFDREQRHCWIDLAKRYKVKNITCVYFTTSLDDCIARVIARANHPTINDRIPSDRRRSIIERFNRLFQKPELNEGFTEIVIL